jgi:transposase
MPRHPGDVYSISSEKRALLVHHKFVLGSSVNHVLVNCFLPNEVQRETISKLWRSLDTWASDQVNEYISSERAKNDLSSTAGAGRKRIIEPVSADENYLMNLLKEHRSMKLRVLTAEFHRFFYEEHNSLPSLSTVYRSITRRGAVYKRITWRNINHNPEEQLQYLDDMISVHPDEIVDIDGMVQNKEDFASRYGWGISGEDCIRMQIIIHEKSYPVMAAYSTEGFLYYEIFGSTVKGDDVARFIENFERSGRIPPGSYMILDNAPNQRTESVRNISETAFHGRYRYCASYSPELKPIERGFSNVKRFIREREDDIIWQHRPIELIEEAFNYYSYGGEGGICARKHFQIYYDNHKLYSDLQ